VDALITTIDTEAPPGPLKLPQPRTTQENRIVDRLRGLATAAKWLPAGLWDELGQARNEHLRLRSRAAAEIDRLADLHRCYRAEDVNRNVALKTAARTGSEPPEDDRTPPADRAAALCDAADRVWSALEVLADHIDATIALVKAREKDWIGDLAGQLMEAEAERREAERRLAHAKAIEWRVHRLAQWVLGTAEDGPLGHGQPVPGLVPPPPNFDQAVFTRPWWVQQNLDLNAS
jgi:hypothetical protein